MCTFCIIGVCVYVYRMYFDVLCVRYFLKSFLHDCSEKLNKYEYRKKTKTIDPKNKQKKKKKKEREKIR